MNTKEIKSNHRKQYYKLVKEGKPVNEADAEKQFMGERIELQINDAALLEEHRKHLGLYRGYLNLKTTKSSSQINFLTVLNLWGKFLNRSYLSTIKADVLGYVKYLREKGNAFNNKPVKDSTIKFKLRVIKGFMNWLIGETMDSIDQEYELRIANEPNHEQITILEQERDRATDRLSKNFLRAFPKDLCKSLNITAKNAGERFKLDETITREDINKMVSVSDHPRDKAFISLFFYGGFRVHEALLLKWDSIAEIGKGFKIQVSPDTKTGARTLSITEPIAVNCLKEWRNNSMFKHDSTKPLFYNLSKSAYGRPLKYHGAKGIIRKAMQKAEIDKKPLTHLFRHSITTIRIEEGMALHELKARHGWKKNSLMVHHYFHCDSEKYADDDLGLNEAKAEEQRVFCSKCGKEGTTANLYCVECKGTLVSKEEFEGIKKLDTKEQLLNKLMQNQDVQEAIKKALKQEGGE